MDIMVGNKNLQLPTLRFDQDKNRGHFGSRYTIDTIPKCSSVGNIYLHFPLDVAILQLIILIIIRYIIYIHGGIWDTPLKINGWNIIMEVWFRSFSFLFMGDGCRFQPLIFQGVDTI